MKLDVLAIGAHPDDVELGSAGTLIKEVENGKNVGILDLTRGEMGTRGTAEIRDQEAENAGKAIGVAVRENLEFEDAFFVNDKAHQIEIARILRKYRPEVVLCNAIYDRHPDHGKGSDLTSQACFISGLRRVETEMDGEPQAAWRPKQVLHYIQWKEISPDIVIDISDVIDKKMDAVKAFKSQFYNADSDEPETPISSHNFLQNVRYRAGNLGRLIGTGYAEGFTTEHYPAIKSVFDLI